LSLIVPILDQATWSELVTELRRLRPSHSPAWTDHDAAAAPVPRLIGGVAVAMITLVYWAALRNVLRNNWWRRYVTVVAADGIRWRRVDWLLEAGPTDPVYELDPSTGRVRFGDGEHGRSPPNGLTVTTRVRYSVGGILVRLCAALLWVDGVRRLWKGCCPRDQTWAAGRS